MKKYAVVRFLSSRDDESSFGYTYNNEIGAKKYDAVIVPTKYGLSLAVVESLTNDEYKTQRYGSCQPVKSVAEVIKSTEVEKLMRAEKKKDIKKKLEAEVKKMDDVARFKMYAAQNPAFSELLEEYEQL